MDIFWPFLSSTSPTENNVYIATGFGPDGLVYGTLASIIISDLILGKENLWAKTFDPKRFTPAASFTRFTKENVSVAAHMIKDHLLSGRGEEFEEIKPGEGKVVNEKVAAYRDGSGTLHMISAICTHMMCTGTMVKKVGTVLVMEATFPQKVRSVGPAKKDLPKILPGD